MVQMEDRLKPYKKMKLIPELLPMIKLGVNLVTLMLLKQENQHSPKDFRFLIGSKVLQHNIQNVQHTIQNYLTYQEGGKPGQQEFEEKDNQQMLTKK